MTNACALCHSIRGTDAHGLVGPDLTHAAGKRLPRTRPNGRGYLEAWVTHAQSMKPDSQMPSITAFTGDDLRALVTYLEGLK